MSVRRTSDEDVSRQFAALIPGIVTAGFSLLLIAGARLIWWLSPTPHLAADSEVPFHFLLGLGSNFWIVWLSFLHFSYGHAIEKFRKKRTGDLLERVLRKRKMLWVNLALAGCVYAIYRCHSALSSIF